ncbi:MAG TPA: DUF4259 domain-containing protein [Candidatus Saccharimonadales bacterium]|jgi:hypothetical protein|nr:DUF4259 domain-containing protein [Candidatus Saccharimonadales bacterium]
MGAWGPGCFENDDASDWADDLEGSSGIGMIKEALKAVEKNKFPESPDCCIALAAAEVVAAAKGKPSPDFPEGLKGWLAAQKDRSALTALDKVTINVINKVQLKSELKELWEDSSDWLAWSKVLNDLQNRVKS